MPTSSKHTIDIPSELCWETPGPWFPGEGVGYDLSLSAKQLRKDWSETIECCRQGLGELEFYSDSVRCADSPIEEWIDNQTTEWESAANAGCAYAAELLKLVEGEVSNELKPCDERKIIQQLREKLGVEGASPGRKNPRDFERDFFVARCCCWGSGSVDFRNDMMETYNVCCEFASSVLDSRASAWNLIDEAEAAGYRLFIQQALDATLLRTDDLQRDFEWLYDLHVALVNCLAAEFPWERKRGSTLLGYAERDIVRLALPLLRWGYLSGELSDSDCGVSVEQVLSQLAPCDASTWYRFSNGFCTGELPERALNDRVFRTFRNIIVRFADRSWNVGFSVPDVPARIEDEDHALETLERLYALAEQVEFEQETDLGQPDRASEIVLRLVEQRRNDQADESDGPAANPDDTQKFNDWFDSPPPANSEFKFGPVEGPIAKLNRWMNRCKDKRTLKRQNGVGWWIQKLHATRFAAYFKTEREYLDAKGRQSESEQNGNA